VRVQRQVRDLSSRRSSSQTLRQSGHNKQRVVLVLLRSVTPDQPHCGHLATIRVSESPFGDGYESSISIRRLTNRDLAARPFKEREPSRSSNTPSGLEQSDRVPCVVVGRRAATIRIGQQDNRDPLGSLSGGPGTNTGVLETGSQEGRLGRR
jgi:hypothetical protein